MTTIHRPAALYSPKPFICFGPHLLFWFSSFTRHPFTRKHRSLPFTRYDSVISGPVLLVFIPFFTIANPFPHQSISPVTMSYRLRICTIISLGISLPALSKILVISDSYLFVCSCCSLTIPSSSSAKGSSRVNNDERKSDSQLRLNAAGGSPPSPPQRPATAHTAIAVNTFTPHYDSTI